MTEPLLCKKINCLTELDNLENNHSFQNLIKRYLRGKNEILAILRNQSEAKGILGKWASSF